MADITYLFNWIPKDSGIIIEEEADPLLYIKYNGEIKGIFNQTKVTEEILKEHVQKLNLEGVIKE